ncbi:asparagine synthase-related protein [Solirubrobacter taibaiensis]|nr:asparagine synthase-related protein [Solirubrobacter taibaiensis]
MTGLAPVELATGIVFGLVAEPVPLPAGAVPAAALEAAVLGAVRGDGPCCVSFSGGRDSSAVLAAATRVARREGRPDPVPLTLRAAHEPHSHESEWQELVVAHLGLDDWMRIEITDELDAVGPYARRVLERHGLLWPFNAHFHLPLLEHAVGGTLLTGIGGDELWSSSRAPVVRRRRRALAYAPFALRRAVLARREPIDYPWLRPEGVAAARRAAGGERAGEPLTVARRMAWYRGMRATATGTAALDRIAEDVGARIAHPLLDRALWGAVATAAPRAGFARRDESLRLVAGELLPEDVLTRKTKAGFDRVFFGRHARAFVARWSGAGIAETMVDVAALRQHWAGEVPDPHSLTLLQAAWLASAGDRVEEPLSRGR